MANPLDQFEIHPLVSLSPVGGMDISFTNSSLWMTIATLCASSLMMAATHRRSLVPNRTQVVVELFYQTVGRMIRDNVGSEGQRYLPFIFSLFSFLLFGNLLGMVPGSFNFTSHLIINFALAAFIFLAVTIIGIVRHRGRFVTLFFPDGAPLWTAPILIPIELISYLSRPISLSVRLFANMMAGHILLKVIAGFVIALGFAGFVPFLLLIGITALEIIVAVLQAYVFTILSCVYLHDALHLH